ncbi:ribonuclease H-like domain-containing protein [Geitlerinema splendidum]|nr:ribonuclease H-like domain-containing protein [Geitlerinema splendidum]
MEDPKRFSVGNASPEVVRSILLDSKHALDSRDHQFFAQSLGSKEAWRAWPEFRDQTVYLDLETDGGSLGDSVTMVGLYDGKEFQCLVKGESLGNFPDVISNYSLIVSFFGIGFDVPMLKKAFPSVPFDHLHLDLCFALKRVGIRGGLKKIERQMGISRGEDTDGLTGLDAIRLWRMHQHGDSEALKTLTEYNREDVVNLERVAEITYSKLKAVTLPEPSLPLGE